MSESHQQRRVRWQAILQQHRESGQTIAEFVRAHGLCRQKFYAWRRRLESPPQGALASVPVEALASPAFVRVRPMESKHESGGSIELRLRRGRRLRVRRDFDRTLLIAVVQALEAIP